VGTVSAVLNGKDTVSPQTKKRVLRAIEELDYRPNIIARALYKNKTNSIGYLVPDIGNPGFSSLLRSVEHSLSRLSYSVFVGDTRGKPEVAEEYLDRMLGMRMDGLLFALTWDLTQDSFIERIKKQGIPAVGVSANRIRREIDCFVFDEEKGGRMAGKYLYNLGHRQVVYLGPKESAVGEARLKGLLSAKAEFPAVDFRELVGFADGYDRDAGYEAMLKILGQGEPFTAVVVFNDAMAIGALDALLDQGFAVPTDVSLLTFGNWFANMTRPKLTTVVNPYEELAKEAVACLLERIRSNRLDSRQLCLFEPKLVIGASTQRPRASVAS